MIQKLRKQWSWRRTESIVLDTKWRKKNSIKRKWLGWASTNDSREMSIRLQHVCVSGIGLSPLHWVSHSILKTTFISPFSRGRNGGIERLNIIYCPKSQRYKVIQPKMQGRQIKSSFSSMNEEQMKIQPRSSFTQVGRISLTCYVGPL